MTSKILRLLVITLLLPLLSIAQKAYEAEAYSGKMNNHIVKFNLANGYIGASKIIIKGIKSSTFIPEFDSIDETGQLKFYRMESKGKFSTDYFILNNMSASYENLPAVINGVYYNNGHKLKVSFRKL